MQDIQFKNLSITKFDLDEKGSFEAIASDESIDKQGDIVKVAGIEAEFPLPFLFEHQDKYVIGVIENGNVTEVYNKACYVVKGYFNLTDATLEISIPKRFTIRELAKKGQISLSIGYIPVNYSSKNINGKNIRILENIKLVEVSAVSDPANAKAVFIEVKGQDAILAEGMRELAEYYDNRLQEKKNLLLSIIKTTMSREEFDKSVIEYCHDVCNLRNKKAIKFIIENFNNFQKRCSNKNNIQTKDFKNCIIEDNVFEMKPDLIHALASIKKKLDK